jgi:hypothetical protein
MTTFLRSKTLHKLQESVFFGIFNDIFCTFDLDLQSYITKLSRLLLFRYLAFS